MNIQKQIHPYKRIIPMIYAYNTPGIPYHEGWTKIGYTDRQTVEERIKQQTHTANIRTELAWCDNAMYKDGSGEYFHDYDFHTYLTSSKNVLREPRTEWFKITGSVSQQYFNEFATRKYKLSEEKIEYTLRKEQQKAVEMTESYYRSGGDEFLWNCKPRFGKTLSAYDLIRTMKFKHVLVVTNRPSIANSWAEDFQKFISWRKPRMLFVSDSDALKEKNGVFTRNKYIDYCLKNKSEDIPYICFESLQNLKGSAFLGGKFDKLEWITKARFDLLIVDESQEGVDTKKTEKAFKEIRRIHTLYLSGTPFKQLAEGRFSSSQIYNWTYADEQQAKTAWHSETINPYERLPRLSMFTYQISPMLTGQLRQGIDFSEDEHRDYAFDLNEFFSTNESGKFVHEDEIKKFIHALSTQKKYPFSTPELRKQLAHTMWYMNRISSAKALEKLLKDDPVFCEYKVVIAAGNVKQNNEVSEAENQKQSKAYDLVKQSIKNYDKTITITVGQLTVGVTIPEWSGVLMLCNLQSPSAYMQAAFRAQNPCSYTAEDGKRYMKETAYVFDFDPARTLIIYDQFANDLMQDTVNGSGTIENRKKNIKRLLNFFPVLGEDDQGTMIELDAAKVLSIPRRLKCTEVVRRGFMSNFLFANITNVFGAPNEVQAILQKIIPVQENSNSKNLSTPPDIPLDENGNVALPDAMVIGQSQDIFGDKIYGEINEHLEQSMQDVIHTTTLNTTHDQIRQTIDDYKRQVKDMITAAVMPPLSEQYGLNKSQQKKAAKNIAVTIDDTFDVIADDYMKNTNIARIKYQHSLEEAGTSKQVKEAEDKLKDIMQAALDTMNQSMKKATQEIVDNKPKDLVRQLEHHKAEQKKKSYEDKIRDHLRGFSRTIPSFLMAYGNREFTLKNLDKGIEPKVFEEVTGITMENFRLLRDGGDIFDEKTGEMIPFKGQLFNEQVFNDSVQEFLDKKEALANYFDEGQTQNIFDYIPPQKTNQIFTPRWVVKKMVDLLEKENSECFADPNHTFADLYMKSGMYIAEIVTRLYQNKQMKELFPDNAERLNHIFAKQVYGCAPTEIIYRICLRYLLGFSDKVHINTHHIELCDTLVYAKKGNLMEKINQLFCM